MIRAARPGYRTGDDEDEFISSKKDRYIDWTASCWSVRFCVHKGVLTKEGCMNGYLKISASVICVQDKKDLMTKWSCVISIKNKLYEKQYKLMHNIKNLETHINTDFS